MRALLLLSGGLDSALCLAMYRDEIDTCIGFNYGQPHVSELRRALDLALHYGRPFVEHSLPFLPRMDDVVFAGRNAVMLTMAVARAQRVGLDTVMIGVNADDHERFPDCRQSFLGPLSESLKAAYGVIVMAPLILSTKAEIVAHAKTLGVPIDLTQSCYQPTAVGPCGKCLACRTRAEAGA